MNAIKTVNVLVDNDSWILSHAQTLVDWCMAQNINAQLVRDQDSIQHVDVCFFLGCVKIVSNDNLDKGGVNLVVHESALPRGKGFAPVAWQILEGKQRIPVSLIEASSDFDSGDIYLQEEFFLNGDELYDEWRAKQAQTTIDICKRFIQLYPNIKARPQEGIESHYPRRKPEDSEVVVEKTIAEQFELLRTVDNKNFPAFFRYRGRSYKLEISEYEK